MAFHAQVPVEQSPIQRMQIYSTSSNGVSPFWKNKYEKDAKKYWDVFYKRHQDKFFKDRHYLDKEWHRYFNGEERKVILEIGCGAGNTVFPLLATYPNVFVHACDFSPRAVNLVKTHKDFKESQISAFVCDLTIDDLSLQITPSSVDVVTMIFVLSAVSPEKMSLVLQNVRKVLKPNSYVLLRDYATGDLAQERLSYKDQKISDNFYVRGDGTRAFYFSNEFLTSLFEENGFSVKELGVCCKQVENRSRGLVMNRRWVQAVFHFSDCIKPSSTSDAVFDENICCQAGMGSKIEENLKSSLDDIEFDMSEGVATNMFGVSPSDEHEIMEVDVRGWVFKIKMLPQENQHICKSTGLILWESSRLMASVLARNPSIVSRKRVLELGCGCGGICSMVAVRSADLVVATDGDENALNLLTGNVTSNLSPTLLSKLITKKLEWGHKDQIKAIKEVSGNSGYDVILGTDVTYVSEAILPLFATARELIASKNGEDNRPALILCHVIRRVDEPSILSAALQFGFRLIDKWGNAKKSEAESIIGSWFSEKNSEDYIPSTALNIMYFTIN